MNRKNRPRSEQVPPHSEDVKLPSPSEIARKVVHVLMVRGLSPPNIAMELFPSEYHRDRASKGRTITLVKRALKYALDNGIVRFVPDTQNEKSVETLRKRHPTKRFTVVEDRDLPSTDIPKDQPPHASTHSVCHAAAHEIARKLKKLWDDRLKEGDGNSEIVVANAGGPSVNLITRYLQAEAIPPERPDIDMAVGPEFVFISLNAACAPNRFNLSANFLAVRMSEILAQLYGAQHSTHLTVEVGSLNGDADQNETSEVIPYPKRYEELLTRLDLIICGAGTRSGMLCSFVGRRGPGALKNAIGDVALSAIDLSGQPVTFDDRIGVEIEALWRPRPTYNRLLSAASEGRVLLVLPYLTDSVEPDPGRFRLEVARAVIDAGLGSHYVMSSSLATELSQGTSNS